LPFNTPACLNYAFTGNFGNNSIQYDAFNDFIDLDNEPGGPFTLVPGTKFDVTINTDPVNASNVSTQNTLVVALTAPLADLVADVVHLSGPTGFHLVPDARLGQPQTISWTAPSFPVANLFISPNVNTASSGPGFSPFCTVQTGNLDPGATQATFTLPATCNGRPIVQANVCVNYNGFNGEESQACWFWTP